jgi:hypothetical protein
LVQGVRRDRGTLYQVMETLPEEWGDAEQLEKELNEFFVKEGIG